jgi:hypothetical protein
MKPVTGRTRYLTIVLALLTLLLVGVLALEWDQGQSLSQELAKLRNIPNTDPPAQAILLEFTLPDAKGGFPELLSRPLFAFGRRPPAAPNKGDTPIMKKGQFLLVGVLITPQHRSALLRDAQTNKTETVALVGVVRGLTLGEVEPGRVVLRQGAESEELILNVQTGPKGTVPARIPAVPARPQPTASPPAVPASAASAPAVAGSHPLAVSTTPPAAVGAASVPKVQPGPVRADPKK